LNVAHQSSRLSGLAFCILERIGGGDYYEALIREVRERGLVFGRGLFLVKIGEEVQLHWFNICMVKVIHHSQPRLMLDSALQLFFQ
jgi:hypothetical protein